MGLIVNRDILSRGAPVLGKLAEILLCLHILCLIDFDIATVIVAEAFYDITNFCNN